MLRIFIGWDQRFPEPADVLRHSILKYSSIPLEIRYLKLSELDLQRLPDPLASTEFTYSRFLVPHLCGYEGKALFLDSDMLCFADIKELDDLEMKSFALRVVKHNYVPTNRVKMYGCPQTSYPRKNSSSLMLMDCAKLKVWSKSVVETETGAYLHQFQDIPESLIGDIPEEWNSLDTFKMGTKLLHFTNGGPWFEQYRQHPHAGLWFATRAEMASNVVSLSP
jgi:lipopolysaccharide biosynthesis glycosyltransferase